MKMKREANETSAVYNGFVRRDFVLEGREVVLIEPKRALAGSPWLWRAEFLGSFDRIDMAMVERGWHLAYYRISDLYGCPAAVEMMRGFHAVMEERYRLMPKTVLIGLSRGGLYAFNYAAKYTEKVAALYLDAPVLDIRSWPGGKGTGRGAPVQWAECLGVYGLTEETAGAFRGNPLDRVEAVARAGIPIAVVAGDADIDVPYAENGEKLVRQYRELGGTIEAYVKPGCEHHPHSLDDPTPVVDFLTREVLGAGSR